MKRNGVLLMLDIVILIFSFIVNSYEVVVLLFSCLVLFRLLSKIGNGSFFLEIVYFQATLTCLLMPLIGYIYYPKTNALAKLWVKYMPVPESQYFPFMLPAVILLGWAFFLFRKGSPDDGLIVLELVESLKCDILQVNPERILMLSAISLVAYGIGDTMPAAFQQVSAFLYFSLFTMLFYIYYYNNFPNRKLFISAGILFILLDAMRHAMFTIIAYMGIIFFILLIAGKKFPFYSKVLFIVSGFLLIVFIQLFKLNLRQSIARKTNLNASEIAFQVIQKNSESSLENIMFPIYMRMNQGFNIGLVMRRIPKRVDFLEGNYLGLTFASAFVPRLFWPDKPEAGGKRNMLIYTGIYISGWSTNVGPIGEAWGNFGYWGWVYIFAFGLFIRFSYLWFIKICKKKPILFLWMPVLFFQIVYVMETDSLQAFNSLIKGAIFMGIIYNLFPTIFPSRKT